MGEPESDQAIALRAAEFLRQHHREGITIADLSDHLSYSASHLTRAFTRAVGASPIKYLAAWRFHRAKHLLVSEGLGVLDVCHEVGFTSVGTFTRRFVRDVGLAPARLRRSAESLGEVALSSRDVPASPRAPSVLVRLEVPELLRQQLGVDPYQWIGTFPSPVPCGVPFTGTLRRGIYDVRLPVLPGAPWILASVTPSSASVEGHVAPALPLVARHPRPLGPDSPNVISLQLRTADPWEYPLLVALALL